MRLFLSLSLSISHFLLALHISRTSRYSPILSLSLSHCVSSSLSPVDARLTVILDTSASDVSLQPRFIASKTELGEARADVFEGRRFTHNELRQRKKVPHSICRALLRFEGLTFIMTDFANLMEKEFAEHLIALRKNFLT